MSLRKKNFSKWIKIDPKILGGTPVFAGTRVPVKNLFDYLEEGETVSGFLDDFPSVSKDQIDAVLRLANEIIAKPERAQNENPA